MYKLLFLVMVSLLIVSCGDKKEKTNTTGSILGVTWLLSDIGDKTLNNNIRTTLEFGDENKISGNGGCNNYFGTYDLYTNGLKISNIGTTRKMCSEDIMEQELSYLDILGKATSIIFNDNKLQIYSSSEITSIKFIRDKKINGGMK